MRRKLNWPLLVVILIVVIFVAVLYVIEESLLSRAAQILIEAQGGIVWE